MKVRLSFIVAAMCLLVLACSTGEKGVSAGAEMATGVAWAKLSLDEAKVEAANQNKLIMVDVFSPT
ncbi:MAG: hypothetical protein ACERK6_05245 [Candidatus Aminicenantaceae bacterium]|jgi:hypothetical protein